MNEKEFIECVQNFDWNNEGMIGEWYSSSRSFIELGKYLVARGFTYEEALKFLGQCFQVVSNEYQ